MHSLTSFLLAMILALAITPAPQSQSRKQLPPEEQMECGTVIPPGQLEAELAGQNIAPLALTPPTGTPYYLPLTIHMVRDSDGIQTGLSAKNLEKVMQNLNQMWRQVGIQFFIYGEVDNSILNDNFFNLPNTLAQQDALRKVNNVPNTINVYFTNLQGNLAGLGTFTKNSTQGILLNYSNMFENSTGIFRMEVFAHEMGHYFNLFHTHETANGVECPSESNCSTAGDLLCDTPADPGLNQPLFVDANCVYTNMAPLPAGCGSTPYSPSTRNLMSLARGDCRNEFTPGQIDKVLNTLRNDGKRKNLIDAKTRYVDRLASESNNSCTYAAPCRTLAKALQAANDGDSIFLKRNTYNASSIGGKRLTLNQWGFESGVLILP